MGSSSTSHTILKLCLFITLILVLSFDNTSAARTLLQRGPVKGSTKNPCSTVPGRSKGRCTLAEIHVAGHVSIAHAPPLEFHGDIVIPKFEVGAASSH
ncbi:unnamed protein product [Lathyrus oleraceus]